MGFWRVCAAVIGCLGFTVGYCDDPLWLVEQEFVKFGKKDAYEEYKKDQQRDFVKKVGFPRYAIEDVDSSQYIYLIPVRDFKGLNTLMQKRMSYHKMLTQGDEKQILPFLSTVNFFIESLHNYLPDCSFVPQSKAGLLDYPAVFYYIYDVIPGNGPIFEEQLKKIVQAQKNTATPVCFRTWRVLFGADVPSYIVAIFAETIKDAKKMAKGLQIIDAQMKNLLRQEKSGSGLVRKGLSSVGAKDGN